MSDVCIHLILFSSSRFVSSINLWSLRHQVCELSDFSLTAASVIASKSQESDYASVAKSVSQQVADYNKSLIELLQNNMS